MKKHLHKTSNFPRYALLFLLGVSAVYFASAYTDINTALINATQYIQKIILTNDGNQSGITGIVLDGVNGKISASQFCDLSGNCKTIDVLGATGAMGATGATGPAGTGSEGLSLWQQTGNNIYYTGVNVGIGTDTPTEALEISGNIKSPGFYSKGVGARVDGVNATAIGDNARARGDSSNAIGFHAEARGVSSLAMGTYSYAIGDNSISIGYQSESHGWASTAIGNSTTSVGQNSLVAGICNVGLSNAIFEIGIGYRLGAPTWACNGINALTVLNDGKVGIGTSAPSALLTVNGGIKPIGTGGNPCGNTAEYPEGTMFYNLTNKFYCFCDGTITGKKMSDESVDCF